MSSAGRTNLSKNDRGISQNFFGTNDPMSEKDWIRSVNSVREQFDITPQVAAYTRGGYTTFKIDKKGDRLGRIVCYFNQASVTDGYSDDWVGYQAVDHVTFLYGNKTYWEYTGEELLNKVRLGDTVSSEYRKDLAVMAGGMSTVTQRQAWAANSQNLAIDLLAWWDKFDDMVRMVALPQEIEVHVHWKTLNTQMVMTNGGPTSGGAISGAFLRCDYHHLPQAKRQTIFNEVLSSPLSTKVSYLESHKRESVPQNASTNTITVKIPLKNIKNDHYVIFACMRAVTAVDNPAGTTLDTVTHYNPPGLMYWLEDSGQQITNVYTQDQLTQLGGGTEYMDKKMSFPDMLQADGQNWMVIPLAMDPRFIKHSERNCYGSRCIMKYNNPNFCLSFTGPASTNYYLDIYGKYHNVIIQYKGEIRKFLQ